MRDVGTSGVDRQAAIEAARRAEEARRKAEIARQQAEAAKKAQEAAEKAKQLEAAVKAEHATDQLKGATAPDEKMKAAAAAELGDVPWAAADKASAEKRAQFPTITAEDLKASPELGKRMAELAKDADPDVQAYVQETTQALVKESLQRNLKENTGGDPLKAFTGEIADLTAKTGLGDVIQGVTGDALKDAAKDLLFEGVDSKEVAENPALGKVLATLQTDSDPAVKDKLQETVRGWTTAALNSRLEGKEGEDDVKDAMSDFRGDLRALAEKTGLGDTLTQAAESSLNSQKDRIEDLAKKGRNIFQKGLDLAGDFFGKALDLGGDLVKGVTDIAGETVDAVTDAAAAGIKQGADLAGDLANAAIDKAGQGANAAANLAADGLEAVGAKSAADNTRQAGKVAEHVADVAGNVANKVIDTHGQVVGGAVDIAGNIGKGALQTAGNTINTVADGAGMLVAEGPMGAANALADKALGPEKAEYAGQVDGFTGVITNRLGKGDSVFLNVEAGAEVGVGAFAGAKINGAGVLGRDGEGNITLSLAVGGSAEVGVSAETGASVNGVGAKADASASLTGQAMGKINLKFNPDDPKDAARLQALLEPTPAKLVGALTNPLALAAPSASALKDAMANNLTSTELSGSAGVSAGAGAGVEIPGAKLKAGIDGEALAGATRKMNTDGTNETKYFFKLSGKAEARASAGNVGASGRAQGSMLESFAVKTDAQGNIIGMKSESSRNGSTSTGAGVGKGFGAEGEGKVTKTETALNAQGLAEAKRLMDAGKSPLEAFSQASDKPENVELVKTTMETDSYTVGVNGKVAVAGVKVGVDLTATIGKTHTESTRIDEPSAEDLNQILNR
jgi:hypothetical protein